jgi:PTS system mannose-specific IIA component
MFGILVVAHGDLAKLLLETAKKILQEDFPNADFYSMDWDCDFNKAKNDLEKKINKMVSENGTLLILTDLFGGTPTNIAMTFYGKYNIEILTGINLPILIKALILQKSGVDVKDSLSELRMKGQDAIVLVSEIIERR